MTQKEFLGYALRMGYITPREYVLAPDALCKENHELDVFSVRS